MTWSQTWGRGATARSRGDTNRHPWNTLIPLVAGVRAGASLSPGLNADDEEFIALRNELIPSQWQQIWFTVASLVLGVVLYFYCTHRVQPRRAQPHSQEAATSAIQGVNDSPWLTNRAKYLWTRISTIVTRSLRGRLLRAAEYSSESPNTRTPICTRVTPSRGQRLLNASLASIPTDSAISHEERKLRVSMTIDKVFFDSPAKLLEQEQSVTTGQSFDQFYCRLLTDAIAPQLKEDFSVLRSSGDLFIFSQVRCDEEEASVRRFVKQLMEEHSDSSCPPRFKPHRLMFCSTADGRASMVRQLQPSFHFDTDQQVVNTLDKKVANVVLIKPRTSPGSKSKSCSTDGVDFHEAVSFVRNAAEAAL